MALVHRQLNPGIRELTVGPIEEKRVMIWSKIFFLILLIESRHISALSV